MTNDDYYQVYLPALANIMRYSKFKGEKFMKIVDEFDRGLGCPNMCFKYLYRTTSALDPIDEGLRRLLKMLAGPHGKVVWKAYLIKRGIEDVFTDTSL